MKKGKGLSRMVGFEESSLGSLKQNVFLTQNHYNTLVHNILEHGHTEPP